MQAVLDAPVTANQFAQSSHFRRVTGDEEHRFLVGRLAGLAAAVNHANRFQFRPTLKRFVLPRGHHVVFSTLLTPMRFLDRHMAAKSRHLIIDFAVLQETIQQRLKKASLIAFDDQQVIGLGPTSSPIQTVLGWLTALGHIDCAKKAWEGGNEM